MHRINLKGPWEYEWLTSTAVEFPLAGRVKMPGDWRAAFGDAAGRVRFRRPFHRPTNLDDDERVWIAFDGVGGIGTVAINGHALGPLTTSDSPQRFDVTAHLEPNSALVVELEFDPSQNATQPGGLFASVGIEIESE